MEEIYFSLACIIYRCKSIFSHEPDEAPRQSFFSSGRRKTVQLRSRFLVFARIWAFIHPASPDHPRPPGARSGRGGPDLWARKAGRRPHRIVFRAL
jgi:hypothetical protein